MSSISDTVSPEQELSAFLETDGNNFFINEDLAKLIDTYKKDRSALNHYTMKRSEFNDLYTSITNDGTIDKNKLKSVRITDYSKKVNELTTQINDKKFFDGSEIDTTMKEFMPIAQRIPGGKKNNKKRGGKMITIE